MVQPPITGFLGLKELTGERIHGQVHCRSRLFIELVTAAVGGNGKQGSERMSQGKEQQCVNLMPTARSKAHGSGGMTSHG
jgi:hypothetical protein